MWRSLKSCFWAAGYSHCNCVPAKQELAGTDKRWTIHPRMEEMKAMAKAQGLWNLWIAADLAANMCDVVDEAREPGLLGAGLSNLVRHPALSKQQAF